MRSHDFWGIEVTMDGPPTEPGVTPGQRKKVGSTWWLWTGSVWIPAGGKLLFPRMMDIDPDGL